MKRAAKAAASKSDDAPRVFPPGTPPWKQRDCGLCGALAGDECFDLTKSTAGSIATSEKRGKGGMGNVRAERPAYRQKTPHETRTRIS